MFLSVTEYYTILINYIINTIMCAIGYILWYDDDDDNSRACVGGGGWCF